MSRTAKAVTSISKWLGRTSFKFFNPEHTRCSKVYPDSTLEVHVIAGAAVGWLEFYASEVATTEKKTTERTIYWSLNEEQVDQLLNYIATERFAKRQEMVEKVSTYLDNYPTVDAYEAVCRHYSDISHKAIVEILTAIHEKG